MKSRGFFFWLHGLENWLGYSFLILVALIPTTEVIARKFFHTGLRGSTDYTHHLVLLITFFGGMITSRERRHLSLALDWKIPEPHYSRLQVFLAGLASMIATAFAWSSLSFILTGFDPASKVGFLPLQPIIAIMVIGYAVMAARFITTLPLSFSRKLPALLGPLCGTLLALDPIINIATFLFGNPPQWLSALQNPGHAAVHLLATPLIILLILALFFGAPIFILLGGIGFLLFARQAAPLEAIPNEAYSMLIGHSLPAIPLFAVTGFILSESRAGQRLVDLFRSFFSWFPGGMAIMAILVCSFFTTFTGASGVTILALGGLLAFVLENNRYPKKFSTGLLTATGSIGLLFPPSLPIILYGVVAQISIKDMFIGGIVPGVVMVLSMVLFSILYSKKHDVVREPFRAREALKSLWKATGEILLPVAILWSYFGGLTTLVESSAIALLYALILEVFIHRDLRLRDLGQVFAKSIPIIGGVLTILALANGLAYYIVDAQIPMQLSAWVQAHIASKYIFLLLVNIALLITGCFMDIFSATIVVVPLIMPLSNIFGIHPVHLGIIFLANMELGYLTPPVGLNLYLASYRFNEPMSKITRDVFPFLLIQLVAVLLITYVPWLSTGLLHLIK